MKLKSITKKGQINQLAPAILALVFAAILLVLGLVINQEMRDTQVTGALGCNATDVGNCGTVYDAANSTVVGLGTFSDFWVIIVLAVVAVVVIGLLLTVFGGRVKR